MALPIPIDSKNVAFLELNRKPGIPAHVRPSILVADQSQVATREPTIQDGLSFYAFTDIAIPPFETPHGRMPVAWDPFMTTPTSDKIRRSVFNDGTLKYPGVGDLYDSYIDTLKKRAAQEHDILRWRKKEEQAAKMRDLQYLNEAYNYGRKIDIQAAALGIYDPAAEERGEPTSIQRRTEQMLYGDDLLTESLLTDEQILSVRDNSEYGTSDGREVAFAPPRVVARDVTETAPGSGAASSFRSAANPNRIPIRPVRVTPETGETFEQNRFNYITAEEEPRRSIGQPQQEGPAGPGFGGSESSGAMDIDQGPGF